MTNPDASWRDGGGGANARQHRAARRWAAKYGRWAAHTEQDRLNDFENAEARDEQDRWQGR